METIIINGEKHTINYQETKIGDKIVDLMSSAIYTVSIHDADDLNWIIIE